MDETLFRSLLYDYYGELLTKKQQACYDLHFNQDLSLQEIAEQSGTTRQAVWTQIRRAEAALRDFEDRLGLVRLAMERRRELEALLLLARTLPEGPGAAELRDRLAALLDREAGDADQAR